MKDLIHLSFSFSILIFCQYMKTKNELKVLQKKHDKLSDEHSLCKSAIFKAESREQQVCDKRSRAKVRVEG